MIQCVSRELLATSFKEAQAEGKRIQVVSPVNVMQANTGFGSSIPKNGELLDESTLSILNNLQSASRDRDIALTGSVSNGFDYRFKNRGSVMEQIKRGAFSGSAGNTLVDGWQDLFDAIRFDLTIRKQAKPTIRQYIYNMISMPNATKDVRPTELFPYGIVFEENNGEGQSVNQGANLGGQYDTIPMKIYAAGFRWTLLAALFDRSYDITRLNDGVALGHSAKQDDLAIAPILAGNYGTVGTAKWTAASTDGDNRQEKMLNTLMNTVDGLGKRLDPVTGRKINPAGSVLLCSENDMRHIEHVIGGLPSDRNRLYPGISAISRVVGYDGEVINMPGGAVTYTGVTDGYAYLIKPNRYLSIIEKLGLTVEVDMQPDVSTLRKEERAWYFVEAAYNALGITNYIQKVTLPTW